MTEAQIRCRTREFVRQAEPTTGGDAATTIAIPMKVIKAEVSTESLLQAPLAPRMLEAPAAPQTKAQLILGLLRRETGATLADLVAATGWLPHTTRAALTGIKRKGHVLSSQKTDGVRTYRVSLAGAPT